MPKKRRQAHIPQQQPTRRRRPARRPDAAAKPVPPERTDLEGQPIFAEDITTPFAGATASSASGPVETRPHWIGSTAQQPRTPGRRTAQLRQAGAPQGTARVTAGQLPTFERAFLADELKRIAIIAGSLFVLVGVLAVVMR